MKQNYSSEPGTTTTENEPTEFELPSHKQASDNVESNLSEVSLNPYKRRRRYFIFAVAFQFLVICGLLLAPLHTLAFGRVITLTTKPVDPWDPFRGDYIIFSYEFIKPEVELYTSNGSTIYSVVKKDEKGEWRETRRSLSHPQIAEDEIIIRGKYESYRQLPSYGIEKVYVSEGRGKTIPQSAPLKVDVALDSSGRSVIKRVRHKAAVLYNWSLF
ncbi:MAG: GDYXXLXY domain-containing protein [Cyanobacteria bacterium]|nr:GDYXXLXY domain-containing protein [Cyanobacteriota bacterium]